jgi:two-component system phosphate regulon response regulator OmpR
MGERRIGPMAARVGARAGFGASRPSDELDPSAPGVLVVDDDPDVVEILVDVLRRRGYRAAGVRDGSDAMADRSRVIPSFGPLSSVDVVVTDLVMPGESGLALMRHVRRHNWPVAIVVVSAFGDQQLRAQAEELRAAAILHKPFYLDELLTVIYRVAPLVR